MKLFVACILAFGIGVGCRWYDVPLPAPTSLIGVTLVLLTTAGYLLAHHFLSR